MEIGMLDVIGTILATTAIAAALTAVASTLPIQLRGRLALAVLAGVWGDFVTGALAMPVAWLAMAKSSQRDRLIVAWNAFGALDLVVAVTLEIMSRNGSPLQLIHAGVGTEAMTTLPWSLVPSVLVPFFLIAHAIVFAQLRARI